MDGYSPTRWTRQHLDNLTVAAATTAPFVDPGAPRVLPHDDIWDMWPVQEPDGSPTVVLGREVWIALAAPARGHPEGRHDVARLRLLTKDGSGWHDLGPAFPDGHCPGSREWSGSAVRRSDGTVSIFYTSAGHRGEPRSTFIQRVVEARPRLHLRDGGPALEHHHPHREILRADGLTYLPADEIDGAPGRIRAFRDPGWFRDPATGREHLLVASSVAGPGGFRGAIAVADAEPGGWTLRPPLLVADGISHEIERPHVVVHDSRYYLFFSAQRHSFHPPGSAPTGLYGFAAPALTGPYEPLNGSGVVVRNPATQPDQAYAWLVLTDLRVVSFVNYLGPAGPDPRHCDAAHARARFGGTVAPVLRLTLSGTTTSITALAAGPTRTGVW